MPGCWAKCADTRAMKVGIRFLLVVISPVIENNFSFTCPAGLNVGVSYIDIYPSQSRSNKRILGPNIWINVLDNCNLNHPESA